MKFELNMLRPLFMSLQDGQVTSERNAFFAVLGIGKSFSFRLSVKILVR